MRISRDDIERSSPNLLANMLRPEQGVPVWRPEELGDILRHQLASPLEFDAASTGHLADAVASNPGPIKSFGDLLLHAAPPLALLEMTKEFAKPFAGRADGELPREVAAVLYFAAIAAALLRHGRKITGLDDAGIRAGAQWVLQQPWLDAALVELFRPFVDAKQENP